MAAPYYLHLDDGTTDYDFDVGEPWFTIDRQEVRGQYGLREGWREEWHVGGALLLPEGETEDYLQGQITALELAVDSAAKSSSSLIQFRNADDSATPHAIAAADTINGLEISGVKWGPGPRGVWGMGVEMARKRSFQFTVRAQLHDPEDSDNQIVSKWISVRQVGNGGPDYVSQSAFQGLPQIQNTALYTPVDVFETGRMVGLRDYPAVPLPSISVGVARGPGVQYGRKTPQKWGRVRNLYYPISWSYHILVNGTIGQLPSF